MRLVRGASASVPSSSFFVAINTEPHESLHIINCCIGIYWVFTIAILVSLPR